MLEYYLEILTIKRVTNCQVGGEALVRALSTLKGVQEEKLFRIIEGEKIVFKITFSNCLRYLITPELGHI